MIMRASHSLRKLQKKHLLKMKHITSRQNDIIKRIKYLQTKKGRDELSLFVIEGEKLVKEANDLMMIKMLLLSSSFAEKYNDYDIENTITVRDDVFSYLSDMKTTQGILAVVKKEHRIPDDICFEVFAQDLQDPGNLGTLIRTSESFGVDLVCLTAKCADPYSVKAVRASMGSVLRMPVITADDTLAYINKKKEQGFVIITGHLHGDDISGMELDKSKKVMFVAGNESRGASDEISALSDMLVKIPVYGSNESLNASVAAGIILFEIKNRLNLGAC